MPETAIPDWAQESATQVPDWAQPSTPDWAKEDPQSVVVGLRQSQLDAMMKRSAATPTISPWGDVPGQPQTELTQALYQELPATIGKGLEAAGQAVGDVVKAYAFEAIGQPALQAQQLGIEVPQKLGGEPSQETAPWTSGKRMLPAVPQALASGVEGLVESAPKMAIYAADPGLGILAFGTTPEGFDPKQAAIAAVLPVIGKYTGAITEAIAAKLGVPNETALLAFNKIGGATGAASLIAADEWARIRRLPQEEQSQAIIDAAGNVGAMFLLGTMGEAKRSGIVEATENLRSGDIAKLAPNTAAVIRSTLPTRPAIETLPELQRTADLVDQAIQESQQRIIVPGRTAAIDLLKAQGIEITPATIKLAERNISPGETFPGMSVQGVQVQPKALRSASDILVERDQAQRERNQNASSQQSATPPDGGVRTRSEVGQLPEGNVEAADARLRGNEGAVTSTTQTEAALQEAQAQVQRNDVAPGNEVASVISPPENRVKTGETEGGGAGKVADVKQSAEYRKGYDSGLQHGEPLKVLGEGQQLYRDNLAKANVAIQDPNTPPKVREYWQGYLDAVAAKPAPPTTSAGVETKQPTGTTNLRQPSTQSQGPGTTAGEKPTTPVVGEQKPPLSPVKPGGGLSTRTAEEQWNAEHPELSYKRALEVEGVPDYPRIDAAFFNFDKLTPEEQTLTIKRAEAELEAQKQYVKEQYAIGKQSVAAFKGTDFEGRGMAAHKSALRTQKLFEQRLERLRASAKSAPAKSPSEMSPEDFARHTKNNSLKAMAEANGVTFVEGDTPESLMAKINAKAAREVSAKDLTPAQRATAEGQKKMASEAASVATVLNLNRRVREKSPSEAWDENQIQSATGNQAMLNSIRDDLLPIYNKLYAKAAPEPPPSPAGAGEKVGESKGLIASTEPVERADVDNGTRQTEYRVRKVTDAERNARWETYGNTPWVVERRTVRTKDGKVEHGEHEEWYPFARGDSKRSAIEDGIADTGFRSANSLDPVHKEVVTRVNAERAWKDDHAKRLKEATNEARYAEEALLRVKDEANKKYRTALKRAGLSEAAEAGKADQQKVDAIQAKLKEKWVPEFETAKSKLAERLAKIKEIEAEKMPKFSGKPEQPTPAPSEPPSGVDKAIKSIEDLQKKIRGSGSNLGMNVPVALLDTALEVARLTLKAGKSITEAIDAAIEHIRKNASFEVKSSFNEQEVRAKLSAALNPTGKAPEPTLSDLSPEGFKVLGRGLFETSGPLPAGAKVVSKFVVDGKTTYHFRLPPKVIGENLLNSPPKPSEQKTEAKPPIRVEGEELNTRKSAARAVRSDQFPEPVRQQIAASPESEYRIQPQKDVREVVAGMSDAELAAVSKDSNIFVASQLQLSKRLFDQGKYDEGYEVFQALSKVGTDFGQNINQFKMLKGVTPFDIVKVVNLGLKKSGRDPLTKPQEEKLATLSNESINRGEAVSRAKNDWMKDPTDLNAKLADDAVESAHQADLELQRMVSRFTPKSWPRMLKAMVQGNPLTPISQVSNIVGNTVGAVMEAGSRNYGAFLNMIRSMLTGKERTLTVSPLLGAEAATTAFGRTLKQSAEIMRRGSGQSVKGETRQNLQPLVSLKNLLAKNPEIPTVGGKVPFNERARMAVEGVFGIAPEVMLRMLSAADRPSYEAARARLINEQMKLAKMPGTVRSMALKYPEMFFTPEVMKRIEAESADAVFQRKSKSVSALEKLIKDHGGDWADLAFTILISPYRLTPWNLIGRTLLYNPLVSLYQIAKYTKAGNTRLADLNAGRFVVGTLLYGAGYFLYKNGLIGPSLDSRDETQKERLLAGQILPPNHVNISGLNRLARGGNPKFQPGDETVDMTRGGGAAGAILSSVANIGRDMEKKPEGNHDLIATLLQNSTLEQASFTINQSFLKGVTSLLDAIRDRNFDSYVRGVESMMMNVASPNTLTTLSRATRKYAPDMKGDTALKDLENLASDRFGVFGADDYLPLKRDLWGQPIKQTPEGRNALLYHLFDISKNQQVTSDPVALELYDLWRKTASREVVPSLPTRQITIKDKTHPLTQELYSDYAEQVGKRRREIIERVVTNPKYQNLNDENKIKILSRVWDAGMEQGKMKFLQQHPISTLPEPKQHKAGFKP